MQERRRKSGEKKTVQWEKQDTREEKEDRREGDDVVGNVGCEEGKEERREGDDVVGDTLWPVEEQTDKEKGDELQLETLTSSEFLLF